MMKFVITLLILTVTFINNLEALPKYKQTEHGPLSIGDKVPDISLGKLINYKSRTAKFSDFRGKLLILDFWAIYCTPCVRALPGLDSLQKKYADKVVIIPVSELRTQENEAKIAEFFAKRKNLDLPTVVEDKTIGQLFPHNSIPHEVWIDENGVIIAITHGEEVNDTNIARYFSNKSISLKEKKDIDFDPNIPLFVSGNGGVGNEFIYRSILTNDIEDLNGCSNIIRDGVGKISGLVRTQASMLQLYYYVYTMGRNMCPQNLRCVMLDSAGHTYPLSNDHYLSKWDFQKHYCYNLTLPESVPDSIFFRKYVLEDLNRFFSYKGRIEKRKVPALVLVKVANSSHAENLLASNTEAPRIIYKEGHGVIEKIQNRPFNDLVNILRTYLDTPPIINETGYTTQAVDIVLNLNWEKDDARSNALDVASLRKSLQKYGLDIIEASNRNVEMLILSRE